MLRLFVLLLHVAFAFACLAVWTPLARVALDGVATVISAFPG